MSVRRFRIRFEDDGHEVEFACAAWPTAADREEALAGLRAVEPTGSDPPPPPETRARGRPSFDEILGAAVAALGPTLDPNLPLAERRRRVLRYLAESGADPADLPKRSTAETYLAAHQSPKKSAKKLPEKSVISKITATGE